MGTGFGGIQQGDGASRTGHLALVGGNAATTNTTSIEGATTVDPAARMRAASTGTRIGAGVQVERSRHEDGVRAVAAKYDNFEEALLPMVLASGVSGEAAVAVAEAIKGNPALTAQAERAFFRARVSAV
jgi:hypothetical protein